VAGEVLPGSQALLLTRPGRALRTSHCYTSTGRLPGAHTLKPRWIAIFSQGHVAAKQQHISDDCMMAVPSFHVAAAVSAGSLPSPHEHLNGQQVNHRR